MRVLYLMSKSNYKPPTLRDKVRWTSNFHDFVKQCLTRNPKKRPSPEKLLQNHPFLRGELSSRLTRDLLDRVNNPAGLQQQQQRIESVDEGSDLEELVSSSLKTLHERNIFDLKKTLIKNSISITGCNILYFTVTLLGSRTM